MYMGRETWAGGRGTWAEDTTHTYENQFDFHNGLAAPIDDRLHNRCH